MLKVLEVASNEVGYLEKQSNAQLDDKTANAGYRNWTKYARDLDALGDFYNGPKNGFDWCDMFVDWCFIRAYGKELGMKLLVQPKYSAGAGCTYSMGYYRSKGRLFTEPQPGDQIFFSNDGWKTSYHTGLVEKVENGYVYTIEGNTSAASGVVCSEFCCGIYTDPLKCAELYAKEICEDLNNYSTAICDWNLILSEIGGPFHNRRYRASSAAMDPDDGCAAPILYNAAKDEVTITPCYYYIGHFSKYVKRGARRIATTKYTADLHVSAFENPDGEKVLVAMNATDRDREIVVRHNDVCTRTVLGAHSIATILW